MNIVVVKVISIEGVTQIYSVCKMAVEIEEDGTLLMNGQRVLQEDYDENYEPTYEGMHFCSCSCQIVSSCLSQRAAHLLCCHP